MKKKQQKIESNKQLTMRYFDTLTVKYERMIKFYVVKSDNQMMGG